MSIVHYVPHLTLTSFKVRVLFIRSNFLVFASTSPLGYPGIPPGADRPQAAVKGVRNLTTQ